MARVMEITTPLGDDLLFHRLQAREELGRLSDYEVDLLSPRGDVDVDKILGQNVTIKLALRDDGTRYFNGYVTRFAQRGMHGRYYSYSASVRPWLWFLTRTADCRIFQNMSVPDILAEVFADHGTADFRFNLVGTYRKWTYCVQYRETDFNFVSRLMEQEGIYYYFMHTDGHDTMILVDSTGKHAPFPGYETMTYLAPERLARPEMEYVDSWMFEREIQPGAYEHDDYDLERPSVPLRTKKAVQRNFNGSGYEVFDYPGEYVKKDDGEQYAAVRLDEFATQFEQAQAATNCRGAAVGSLFTLERFPREDQNGEYLIASANYDLAFSAYEGLPDAEGASYTCRFSCIGTRQQFRAARTTPKPFVQGPQTAVVVGPAGEQIFTDKYGRVKVQFRWDRYGRKDENSSCWVRVSHPWAGKGWGSVATPRIGQEVIVDFLEGDPDQPIITGRVYNAEQVPPFGFPAGAVLSGFKSDTHKGSGYNEISADDTAGKEKITIHAQYDMNTTVEHDQKNTVKGKMTEVIEKDTSITINTGKLEHKVNTATASYYVKGAVTQKFENIWDSKVTGKVSVKSNADVFIDSDTKITLVTGASKLVMDSAGVISLSGTKISVTGAKVTVIGNDEVKVSSAKTEVTGSTEAKFGTGSQNIATNAAKTAISGTAINSSAVGMHEISGAVVKIN